jgi:hypothetical protein
MLDRFPKTRPPLPKEIAEIYVSLYKQNRTAATPASSLSQRVESWLHRQVAADVRSSQSARSTLEIGAGTLNQLPYEPVVGPYDIVEPFKELYEDSPHLGRVRSVYADIAEVPAGSQYDRITAVATFEHVENLPEVIARAGLMLAEGGTLRTAIPSEGTPLWTLGWMLTTGLEFRLRTGLDYGQFMKHEHVNNAAEIEALLRYFFKAVRGSCLGLVKQLSIYQFYECTLPDAQKCRDYLTRIAKAG